MTVLPPFKPPTLKTPDKPRLSRAAANDCRGKLAKTKAVTYVDDSDEEEYIEELPPAKKLQVGVSTSSYRTLSIKDNVPHKRYVPPSPEVMKKMILKPFVCPLADPVKRAEAAKINPYTVVLGMRPLFNHRSLLEPLHDPNEEGAIVLYTPKKTLTEFEKIKLASSMSLIPGGKKGAVDLPEIPVVVDPKLGKILRPHQVAGVKFLYKCVTGQVQEGVYGCIMADEMGLGKTLQCVTLLWTLIRQSPTPRKATAEKVIIVCPSTLVKNWANEFKKWLGEGKVGAIVCDHKASAQHTAKEQLALDIQKFLSPSRFRGGNNVLIISYDTLRENYLLFGKAPIGLMLCDEGHKLKNAASNVYINLNQLNVQRRVILSGTPVQNDLTEYFSLLNFTIPNVLGSPSEFRRRFENPILDGRDASASEKAREIGDAKLQELNALASRFIIRRTNDLLNKYLPTKYEYIVFCKPTSVQTQLYKMVLESKKVKKLLDGNFNQPLQSIILLRKLVNHPSLLKLPEEIEGSESIIGHSDQVTSNSRTSRYSRDSGNDNLNLDWSAKLLLLDSMLAKIKRQSTDKIVLISNFTSALDVFERLCKYRGYSSLRLDGKCTTNKRQKQVDLFNDPSSNYFVFLLSSKAGGCGINLIGANRLVLFDPDWNPASDEQALARVWRDGQKKTCFIYRFITAGTIEEKVFQRQTHKKTLSSVVVDEKEDAERHFSRDDLRALFDLDLETECGTHDTYNCKYGCDQPNRPNTTYSDHSSWTHFPGKDHHKLADNILKVVADEYKHLSYVFQFKSHDPLKV